jgi:hypothetical protein
MFIETVPNRTSPPAVLLRESYRDEQGGRAEAHIGPPEQAADRCRRCSASAVERRRVIGTQPEKMQIERSLPHGHVAVARRHSTAAGYASFGALIFNQRNHNFTAIIANISWEDWYNAGRQA